MTVRISLVAIPRILLMCLVTSLLTLLATSCASARETQVRTSLSSTPPPEYRPRDVAAAPESDSIVKADDETESLLGRYTAEALRHHPGLEASFEAWRQAVLRVSSTKQLPAPQLTFGVFLLSVETRVGPQLGRVGLRQAFPWPGKLFAGADAATARALAAQFSFEAKALSVTEHVAVAYWSLWEVRQAKRVHTEHLVLMRGIADAVRGRLVTGFTSVADVQQIDLGIARLEDMVRGLDEKESIAAAQLRMAAGLDVDASVPTQETSPDFALPAAGDDELRQFAHDHPSLQTWDARASAADASAQVAESKLYPSFSVGADWIITGASPMPGVADSDKDAIMLGGGISVPVWNWLLDNDAAAARADARQQRAMRHGAQLNTDARLTQTLARLRDAYRRKAVYADVLIPQAEATTQAILGAFSTGKATVAQALLAQRDVLELRILHDAAVAQHARAWAQLQNLVGQELESTVDAKPETSTSATAPTPTPLPAPIAKDVP